MAGEAHPHMGRGLTTTRDRYPPRPHTAAVALPRVQGRVGRTITWAGIDDHKGPQPPRSPHDGSSGTPPVQWPWSPVPELAARSLGTTAHQGGEAHLRIRHGGACSGARMGGVGEGEEREREKEGEKKTYTKRKMGKEREKKKKKMMGNTQEGQGTHSSYIHSGSGEGGGGRWRPGQPPKPLSHSLHCQHTHRQPKVPAAGVPGPGFLPKLRIRGVL